MYILRLYISIFYDLDYDCVDYYNYNLFKISILLYRIE